MNNKYLSEYEIGLDEAGRGPLIGRVYAGAVIWDPNIMECECVNDSKKLSKKKRLESVEWIKKNALAWGIGYAEADEIDKINILNATKIAMERALDNLKINFNLNFSKYNTLIIDGLGWEKKFDNYNVKSIIKGDTKFYSIAAASILAKVYHDEYIINLCETNKDLVYKYDLLNNMGYPTKKHLLGIKNHGITMHHRKTFKPCL